ncbi:two component regulator [Planoprotostelium fungivorum]|uniref:Two component regulator n=1 Tax=Planoprotostelium fungivorum TaxID=1890364 RepID=A0A2P6MVJ2_9EUKA|nr:two component regulator [Planoprotostelium fungivorum]
MRLQPSLCHLIFLVHVVIADQKADLTALYNSAGGSSWKISNHWNQGDPCGSSWAGITCSGSNVTGISLGGFGLQGNIPDSFGTGLSQVTKLNITMNYQGLSGTPLPSGLSMMISLEYLCLNSNGLAGKIPDLSGLVNLIQIDFQYNSLTGFVNPNGLSALTKLQYLSLYRNSLTSIPSSVTVMSSLFSLRAECNNLNSIDSGVWSMSQVTDLSLGCRVRENPDDPCPTPGNSIYGLVPQIISPKNWLDLSGNQFEEFEDYNANNPLNDGVISPAGPNFACPVPYWASSSCNATCTCYTPTTSSGGSAHNLEETDRITGCYSGWKVMHRRDIQSYIYHVYSPCMSERTEHGKCSRHVRMQWQCQVIRDNDDIPGTHNIVDNVFKDIFDDIIYHIDNESDDIHNVDDQADYVYNQVYDINYIDNQSDDINYSTTSFTTSTTKPTTSTTSTKATTSITSTTKPTTSTISTTKPTTSTTSTTKPFTSTKSSTTSIATTTDIPFCDQIFLSFNRSLSSSVLQDQLRAIQPFAMQCPEQLNAVVLQIASTNLQRNKTFVVEAGNISIAAGKIENGTQMHLAFDDNAASAVIPSDVADVLPINSFAVLTLSTFNPYVTSSTDSVQYTNLVSLSVISPNGTEIHVHNTSSAIEIGMDYNAVDGYEIECVWWDNSTRGWNREGCRTDTSSQPVKCLCSHLTSFSLQVTPKEVPPSEIAAKPFPWKWLGIGVGGFVFLLAVIMVMIAVLTRRRWKRREDYDLGMQSISHIIPADQIEVTECLSTRMRRGRYQLADVVITRQQSGDGLSEHLLQVTSKSRSGVEISSTTQRVRHVNIVQYLGCYSDSVGDKYFVYNYVAGIELSKWITATEYDNDMAEHLVMQLANVMTYLIDQGVTDNIVTAEKVIIQPDNKGYVLRLWDLRSNVQRPELYVPPEKKLRTEAAQVWAFGILSMQIIDQTLYPREYYDDKEIPNSLTLYAVKQRCRSWCKTWDLMTSTV